MVSHERPQWTDFDKAQPSTTTTRRNVMYTHSHWTRALTTPRFGTPEVGEPDAGMSTAEYAIGTIAAAALAAVLYSVVTGDSVLSALTGLVQRALSVNF
jgi:hypothetical protein